VGVFIKEDPGVHQKYFILGSGPEYVSLVLLTSERALPWKLAALTAGAVRTSGGGFFA
jgi:hypothetical protein